MRWRLAKARSRISVSSKRSSPSSRKTFVRVVRGAISHFSNLKNLRRERMPTQVVEHPPEPLPRDRRRGVPRRHLLPGVLLPGVPAPDLGVHRRRRHDALVIFGTLTPYLSYFHTRVKRHSFFGVLKKNMKSFFKIFDVLRTLPSSRSTPWHFPSR